LFPSRITPVPLFQYVDQIKVCTDLSPCICCLDRVNSAFYPNEILMWIIIRTQKDMKIFLTVERIRALSDSVLFVAVVLLVYNLASLATSDPDIFNPEIFFKTLVAYINSFIVVFLFLGNIYKHFELHQTLNRNLIFIDNNIHDICYSDTGCKRRIITTRGKPTINYFCFNNSYLSRVVINFIIILFSKDEHHTYCRFQIIVSASLIPAVYFVSLLVSYANIFISQLIVLSIIPLFIVIRKMVCKISNTE